MLREKESGTTEDRHRTLNQMEEAEFSQRAMSDEHFRKLRKEQQRIQTQIQQERSELQAIKANSIEKTKVGNGFTVYKIDINNKIVDKFPAAKEVGELLKLKDYEMLNILNKESDKLHFGFFWVYQKDYKLTFDYAKQAKYLKHIENQAHLSVVRKTSSKPNDKSIFEAKTKFVAEKESVLYHKSFNNSISEQFTHKTPIYNNSKKELMNTLPESAKDKNVSAEQFKIDKGAVIKLAKDFPGDLEEFKQKYPNAYAHIIKYNYLPEIEALGQEDEESESQLHELNRKVVETPVTYVKAELTFEEILSKATEKFETTFRELSKGVFQGKVEKRINDTYKDNKGEERCSAVHITFKLTAK